MTISRRVFLRATVAAAGAVLGTASCADDSDPSDAGSDAGSDTGNGDTGNGDTGNGDTGNGDTGNGDTGNGDTGNGDTGLSDAGDTSGGDADTGPSYLDGAAFFTLSVASGDPRPDSLILWTRVSDDDADGDLTAALQVALDADFTQRIAIDGADELPVTALADADGCVKVRLTELEPATEYYYRFVYRTDEGEYASRIGRARTAPEPDADVAVRFAVVSCQDYNGRFYNCHKFLAAQDIEFFVHLGDYVYETSGDPSFQDRTDRAMLFTDLEGAIELHEDDETFYSANSLDNYRELYRTYRSDPALQRLHEHAPMIAVWDDHEFADDAHGVTTTMFGGRVDEADPERRRNANQAWFEYMPVDYDDPDFVYDRAAEPPDDIRIYRDLRFGANVHLVLTDLRLFRPDHPVPEDAFPGRVAIDEEALIAQEGELPDWAEAYIDVDAFAEGIYADALTAAADLLGYDASHATGLVAVRYVNSAVEALIAAEDTRFELIESVDELPRGLAFLTLGKGSPYSSIGSRYLAIRAPYLAYARSRYAASSGASEDILGAAQEAWMLQTLRESDARWKVWGSEYTVQSRVIDTHAFAVPDAFRNEYLLSVEDWDGCPNKRDELVGALADIGDVVVMSGDIHAFFAGTPSVPGEPTRKIPEFVGGALSSNSYQTLLLRTAASDPALRAAGATALALLVEDLLLDKEIAPNPHLAHANISENGVMMVEADSESFGVTFWATSERTARAELPDADVAAAFSATEFEIRAGQADLFDSEGLRWDPTTLEWV